MMPLAPASLATRFVDRWEFTVAPTAGFGSTAPITRWRTRSHTSNACERSLRKNCGGSSLARKGHNRITRRVREGHFNATKNWERTIRIPHFGAHRDGPEGWPELHRALPVLRGPWTRPERRQPGH